MSSKISEARILGPCLLFACNTTSQAYTSQEKSLWRSTLIHLPLPAFLFLEGSGSNPLPAITSPSSPWSCHRGGSSLANEGGCWLGPSMLTGLTGLPCSSRGIMVP